MSWKCLVCAGLLCGLVVVPAAADPSLSVDLVRDGGGLPVLDAAGNWQFSVSVIPDAALFTDPADSPDRGNGGSTAIEVGLSVTQAGGPVATVGGLAATANVINDNPGLSPFGAGLVDSIGLDAVAHQIDAFLGSDFFTSAGAKELFTFSAGKPASLAANGSLTVTVDASGGYSSAYRVAQGGSNFDIADAVAFTATVLAGDANLNGTVDLDDVFLLSPNFGSTATWSGGDFDGNGNVDLDDVFSLSPNFGSSTTPPSGAVPEPATALLIALAGALLAAVRVRR